MTFQPTSPGPPSAPASTLSPHEVRELAVRARVHPTTVARFLRGEPIRSTVRARLTDALQQVARDRAVAPMGLPSTMPTPGPDRNH